MIVSENHSTTVQIDGKEYLYFGGTNYLGLSHRPELMLAATKASERYGFSTCASRLTSGETELLIELERELAQFTDADAALVLPAGFLSNQAVVDGIDSQVDFWVVQKQAHGSITSALARSRKPIFYHEKSIAGETLRKQYRLPPDFKLGVFAEPITPLVGELSDIEALCNGLTQSDFLILDEAHTMGVLGQNGKGAREHFKLDRFANQLVRTGTFSKAFGSCGGFVVASEDVILSIKQHSTSVKESTSLSPPVCAAALEALRLVKGERAGTVDKLKRNIEMLNSALTKIGIESHRDNCFPIYYLENSKDVVRLKEDLFAAGIYIPTVTSYFTGYCEIGLRWTIQAGHTLEQLDRLIDRIAEHVRNPASVSPGGTE